MNKEQKCISLPLAQELQKIAEKNKFKLPESEYCWTVCEASPYPNEEPYLRSQNDIKAIRCKGIKIEIISKAYDSSELGEIIPGNIEGLVFQMQKGMLGNLYYCMMIDSIGYVIRHQEEAKTEAEARGQMFSYLIKNKLT